MATVAGWSPRHPAMRGDGKDNWQWPQPRGGLASWVQSTRGRGSDEPRKQMKPRRAIAQSERPTEPGKWCKFDTCGSHLWFESSYFTGECHPPSHPRVRSFNRFISAATTTQSPGGDRQHGYSLRRGRKIWEMRSRVAQGLIQRPAVCTWHEQPNITPYGVGRVVYAVVSARARDSRVYVGVTSKCPYERQVDRVRGREEQQVNCPFESHIKQIGTQRALDDYYVIVLEHVPLPHVSSNIQWANDVKPWERFWVQTLGTAFNRRGWNVEHAPRTLPVHGKKVTQVSSEERRRRRGRNGPLAAFGARTPHRPCPPPASELDELQVATRWSPGAHRRALWSNPPSPIPYDDDSRTEGSVAGAVPTTPGGTPPPSAPPSPPGVELGETEETLPLSTLPSPPRDEQAERDALDEQMELALEHEIDEEGGRDELDVQMELAMEQEMDEGPVVPAGPPATTAAERHPAGGEWWRSVELVTGQSSPTISAEARTYCANLSPLHLTTASRIVRAQDAFGILAIPLAPQQPPADATIHQAYEEVRDALSREAEGMLSLREMEILEHARYRLNQAWFKVRRRGSRLQLWARWAKCMKPTTQTLRCPVDVGALMEYAQSPAADTYDGDRKKTHLDMIEELLRAVDFEDDATGWITLSYTFSWMGARLAAGGFVRYGREYAEGKDPFKLPKTLRQVALGRFGLDFDDSASYPTAAAALLTEASDVCQMYADPTTRAIILRTHGLYFFDGATHGEEARRSWVKELYNALENDGSIAAWKRRHSQRLRPGATMPPPLMCEWQGAQKTFTLEGFAMVQTARTQEVARRAPATVAMIRKQNEVLGQGAARSELTAKSYILGDREGLSRWAKQVWCRAHGCVPINLQHDGVFIRLSREFTPEEVAEALTAASSQALGYDQLVTIKSMPEPLPADVYVGQTLDAGVAAQAPRGAVPGKRTPRGRRARRAGRTQKSIESTIPSATQAQLRRVEHTRRHCGEPALNGWLARLSESNITQLYRHLCILARQRPSWCATRDVVAQVIHGWHRAVKYQRKERSLLIGGYVAEILDGLCVSKLLKAEERWVPSYIWDDVGRPLVTWKYATPPAVTIMNFATAVRTLDAHGWRTWAVDDARCTPEEWYVIRHQLEAQHGWPCDVTEVITAAMGGDFVRVRRPSDGMLVRGAPELVRRCLHRRTPQWQDATGGSKGGCSCCTDPRLQAYLDAEGHVVTTDLSIIGLFDEDLRALMEKGPSYRTSFVELREPPKDSPHGNTLQGKLMYMFHSAFSAYIADKQARYEYDVGDFHMWADGVLEKLEQQISGLSPWAIARTEEQLQKSQGETEHLKRRVAEIHERFVIAQADKERVYTVCCRHHYERKVMKELESGQSYRYEGGGAKQTAQWRRACQKALRCPLRHTFPQELPIMPTGDSEPPPAGAEGPAAPPPQFGSYVAVMQELHRFCVEGGYIRAERDADGKHVSQHPGETPLSNFLRRTDLSYLYATIKSHKAPMGWRFIAGGTHTPLQGPNDWLSCIMQNLLPEVDALHVDTLRDLEAHPSIAGFFKHPCMGSFNLKDSRGMVARLRTMRAEVERQRTLLHPGVGDAATRAMLQAAGPVKQRTVQFGVWDFTTLYLSLDHDLIVDNCRQLLDEVFAKHATTPVLEVCVATKSIEWVERKPDVAKGSIKHYTCDEVVALLAYIVRHAFVAVGDVVYRQTSGIPMGFGASPQIAIYALSCQEIVGLRELARIGVQTADGDAIDTPEGSTTLTPAVRARYNRLIATMARCCRNIDDVLFIDMSRRQQEWAYEVLYHPRQTRLEMKMECCSPGRLTYLDTEILRGGRMGVRTIHYDKRIEMKLKRGDVTPLRRFPHYDSKLSVQCKYAVLTGFLNRVHRAVMVRSNFVQTVAAEMSHMQTCGYNGSRLQSTLRSFMLHAYHPPAHAPVIRRLILATVAAEQLRLHREESEAARLQQMWADAATWAAQTRETQRRAQTAAMLAAIRRRCRMAQVLRATNAVTRRVQGRLRVMRRRAAMEAIRGVTRRVLARQVEAAARRQAAILRRRVDIFFHSLPRPPPPPPPPLPPWVRAEVFLRSMAAAAGHDEGGSSRALCCL